MPPQRNIIERHFSWVKALRRICTRFDKLASSFEAMRCIACNNRCLRANFSDKT
ncbi:transposase [Halomonas vilamensis]|uniref:Transposase n=1 Tax=Vreelandella vilamensis TaxID=531309 RepID=A0ABU1H906_9GAMM|nr:transposase [Halomonas vilamensis]MDR5900336.1 transposase [Halomonas vilamensis]